MAINVRIRNGLAPDPISGLGGATEGDIRGDLADMISNTGGVVDVDGGHLLVHEQAVPDMTVLVDDGIGYIPNSDFDELDSDEVKFWEAVVSGEGALTIAANASGSTRIDLICLKLNTATEPDEDASNIASLVVVAGTPGAGQPATPDDHLLLAAITVANGETEITDAEISDEREQLVFKDEFLENAKISGPEGLALNGKIVPSVASNNLTVAIKGLDGNDPSASNPVHVRINGVIRTITSALSVTLNAGTNYFTSGGSELATREVDYFVYLGYNTAGAAVRLGFARVPNATSFGDSGQVSGTNTDEKYLAASGTLDTGDRLVNIGRFAATLSAGAGYTWTVPTFDSANLIQRSIFETRWLGWTPTATGFSTAFSEQRYKIMGNIIYCIFSENETSNSAAFDFTLPMIAHNVLGVSENTVGLGVLDNTVAKTAPGLLGIAVGGVASRTAKVGLDFSTRTANAYGGFTTSGTKGLEGQFFYSITPL